MEIAFNNCIVKSVNPAHTKELGEKLNGVKFTPYDQFKRASTEAGLVLSKHLMKGILDELMNIRNRKLDCLIIKGMPVAHHELVDTPLYDDIPGGKDYNSELSMLGLSKLLNARPYLNVHEKDGSIIQQVIPLQNREATASGGGFKTAFFSHTENAHEAFPPDLFMLLCLRGNENAMTTFIPIEQLLSKLPSWVIEGMKERNFIFKTGPSYTRAIGRRDSILGENEFGQLTIRHNANEGRMEACNSNAEKVLSHLNTFLQDRSNLNYICLEQGDCIIMDNKRVLHGRTTFQDDVHSPHKRWLQRLYLHRK